MEVNETRNCLVTDILLNIRKLAEWIKTQLFNSLSGKMSLFPKNKVEYPFNEFLFKEMETDRKTQRLKRCLIMWYINTTTFIFHLK